MTTTEFIRVRVALEGLVFELSDAQIETLLSILEVELRERDER